MDEDEELSSDEELDHGRSAAQTYGRGAVRRIRLHNFLTYQDCEFKPGPRLNMVIGPNGSGKSSIVCALALGLGGSPNLLGRASDVGSFVRHGTERGFTEIELEDPNTGRGRVVIRREIKAADNTSAWFLDDKRSNLKQVKERLSDLRVQVDNLCQFLPQDRVGDFTRLDPKQLLRETVLACIGKQHVDLLEELVQLQKNERESGRESQTQAEHLDRLRREVKESERDVDRMRTRQQLVEEVRIRELKLPWIKFDTKRNSVSKMRDEATALKAEVEVITAELKPLQSVAKKAKKAAEQQQESSKEAQSTLRKQERVLKRVLERLDEASDAFDSAEDALVDLRDEREGAATKIEKAKKEVQRAQQKLDNMRGIDEIKSEMKDIRTKMVPLQMAQTAHEEGKKDLEGKIKKVNRSIKRKHEELAKLNDDQARRLNRLKNLHPDGGKGMKFLKWLEQERAAGRLKSEVYGPIMNEISVKDKYAAHFVETAVNARNMKVLLFVTTDKRDWEKINRSGYRIGIINVSECKAEHPPMDRDFLKKCGIHKFLDELIEGPPQVIQALRNRCRIDKILCGNPTTQKHVDSRNLMEQLTDQAKRDQSNRTSRVELFTPEFKIASSVSIYSKNVVTNMSQMRDIGWGNSKAYSPLVAIGGGVSEAAETADDISRVQREIEEERAAHNELLAQLKKMGPAFQASEKQIDTLSRQRQMLLQEKNDVSKVVGKLKAAQKRADELVQAQAGDWEKREKKAQKVIDKAAAELSRIAQRVVAEKGKAAELAHTFYVINLRSYHLKSEAFKAEEAYQGRTGRLKEARNDAERAQRQYKENYKILKDLSKRAKETYDLHADPDNLKPAFDRCPNDLEELEAEITEKKHAAAQIIGDQAAIRTYQRKLKEIEELEPKVAAAEHDRAKLKDSISEKTRHWIVPVTKCVTNLSMAFQRFFKDIHRQGYECAGEVALVDAELNEIGVNKPPRDFSGVGIGIKVKFRAAQDLQFLGHSQSGGERSLSTFLYLLAMQTLTQCPFRVVDEINQGMDKHKERLAFNVLVETSCAENRPQYFLITPKLLTGLKYHKNITVLFIFNGPYCIDQKQWDLEKFIATNNALKRKASGGGSSSGGKRARTNATVSNARTTG